MANAMCGSSNNALKSFSSHVGQDRSLHQDRAGPASQPQISQFRAADRKAVQSHDAHFNAHLADSATLGQFPKPEMMHMQPQPGYNTAASNAWAQASSRASEAPDWALSFQQMNLGRGPQNAVPVTASSTVSGIGGTADSQVQDGRSHMLMSNNWTTGFPQQQDMGWPQHATPAPWGIQAGMHQQNQLQKPNHEFSAEMDQWMAAHGPAAEAALNREMEDLARELEEQEAAQVLIESQENLAVQPPDQELGQEIETATEENASAQNTDELAAAARRIVDMMDTTHASDKMKQSGFLGLMRKLADGDVMLKDQDFVDDQGAKVSISNSRTVEDDHASQKSNFTTSIPARPSVPEWEPIDLTRAANMMR